MPRHRPASVRASDTPVPPPAAPRPMRVLRVMLLATDLEQGGLPLRLVRLAEHLPSVGVVPIVGCLAGRGPLHARLESRGVETFSCDAAGPWDAGCLVRFARHVRRLDPDLIHASLAHANLAARLCGRPGRWRPILTSTVTIEIERRWHRWAEALTAGLSDLHVANSAAVGRHLREDLGFPPQRLAVIPNGLDLEAIDRAPPVRREDTGLEAHVPLIAWAGRMDPVKGLETFVEVIARLRRRTEIRAVLLGDGPERHRIETCVATRGLEEAVRFTGWSDQVAGWLKTADVLLLPSRTEGCPNVIIEAMACGCPVVASDAAGCAELIRPGRTGVLCPVGDAAGFAACVLGLLADSQARDRLAREARRVVERRHRIQDVVGLWRSAYDRLMSETRPA